MSWYDTRNDPTRLMTDVFFGRSSDGGLSFGPNVQVTTSSTNETCPPTHLFFQWACDNGANLFFQYGDYEGIAAFGGVVHPVWTDRRASVTSLGEEVFTATITFGSA